MCVSCLFFLYLTFCNRSLICILLKQAARVPRPAERGEATGGGRMKGGEEGKRLGVGEMEKGEVGR